MDEALRNALWSITKSHYWDRVCFDDELLHPRLRLSAYGSHKVRFLCQRLWLDFFKLPIDTLQDEWETVYSSLRKLFFSYEWFEVYDFVEFLAQNFPDEEQNASFMQSANTFLEREVSAYRFVNSQIVQITDRTEIDAIENAAEATKGPIREHLDRAVQLLADRRAPDYRNSIKESISAVEALVRSSAGADRGTLGELLKVLSRRHPLHPALEKAFSKLYGYTSDAKGIRHALMDDDSVTFEEAKFMLVACSAFVNYARGILKS